MRPSGTRTAHVVLIRRLFGSNFSIESSFSVGVQEVEEIESMTGTVDVSKLDKNPNEPRAIRARVGMTEDPLPPGKKLEEKP